MSSWTARQFAKKCFTLDFENVKPLPIFLVNVKLSYSNFFTLQKKICEKVIFLKLLKTRHFLIIHRTKVFLVCF